ncbi:hypothetical protein Gotri_003595, partial [Gossypium trilobum]|nr:hypothetical protein [Gossypium trilobum]
MNFVYSIMFSCFNMQRTSQKTSIVWSARLLAILPRCQCFGHESFFF